MSNIGGSPSSAIILRPNGTGAPLRVALLFLAAAWLTVITAAILSALGHLDSPLWWLAIGGSLTACLRPTRWARTASTGREYPESSQPIPASLLLLIGVGALAAVSDVLIAVSAAPAAWDALSYHLPRVAFSLQAGHFYTGAVNFWAQAAHPVLSTALLALPGALSGGSDRAWAVWQLAGAAVAATSVFGLARASGASPRAAIFSALVFCLLPSSILQAPTATNDMLLAAVTGVAAILLIRWCADGNPYWLAGFVAAIGLGLGIKATFVCQTVMLITIGMALPGGRRGSRSRRGVVLAAATLAGVALALPAGYVSNIERYGNPLGPPEAVAHAPTGAAADRIGDGMLNTLRLATDFISLDGLPPIEPVASAQHLLRRAVAAVWRIIPEGDRSRGLRAPFLIDRPMLASEVHAYWGLPGLVLLWPAIAWNVFRGRGVRRALALGAAAYVVLQGFAGPYDPWRGRYFVSSALVAAPLAGGFWDRRGRGADALRWAVVAVIATGGIYTAVFRSGARLVPVTYAGKRYPAIWSLDRSAQLTRNRPSYAAAVRRYYRAVPPGSVVVSALAPDSIEFALFGPSLDRVVIPLGERSLPAIPPAHARFLVFSNTRLAPQPGDEPLGEDLWLRSLIDPVRPTRAPDPGGTR